MKGQYGINFSMQSFMQLAERAAVTSATPQSRLAQIGRPILSPSLGASLQGQTRNPKRVGGSFGYIASNAIAPVEREQS